MSQKPTIFLTPQKPQNVPLSQLLGRNSKFASMAQNLVLWRITMQNSLAYSVWAEGERWFEKAAAVLIFVRYLYAFWPNDLPYYNTNIGS